MTAHANGNGQAIEEPLVVVRVENAIDPALAGRGGASYQSPPQPREQAMALVWLLLGRADETPAAPGDGSLRSRAVGGW
jgi:hypothetical protein